MDVLSNLMAPGVEAEPLAPAWPYGSGFPPVTLIGVLHGGDHILFGADSGGGDREAGLKYDSLRKLHTWGNMVWACAGDANVAAAFEEALSRYTTTTSWAELLNWGSNVLANENKVRVTSHAPSLVRARVCSRCHRYTPNAEVNRGSHRHAQTHGRLGPMATHGR